MNDYEAKRQARIERLEQRAARHQAEAERLTGSAQRDASIIPLGQPILVGHHSERRDRNFRERINRRFERGWEEQKKAEELARRAEAAARNTAVSSDDPDAVAKLKEKLAKEEETQEKFKGLNKAVRSKDPRAALAALGLSEDTIARLLTPDFCGRIGIPDYEIRNRSANIRRIKQRIEELERKTATPPPAPETHGDIRIEESDNRVRIYFPSKPSEDVRRKLKSFGFRWSPTEGAWQAYASPGAWYKAREIAKGTT